MEENTFFKWTTRINSVLFLILLVVSTGIMIYLIVAGGGRSNRNAVEIKDKNSAEKDIENLRLGGITKICGKDVQFVELKSDKPSKGGSSYDYGGITRNIVFFSGIQMDAH